MLEAKFKQVGLLKNILKSLKEVIRDGYWNCQSSGITVIGRSDVGSAAMVVEMHLSDKEFAQYNCDRNVYLGINHANLSKILEFSNTDDVFTLFAGDLDPNTCSIFLGPNEGETISSFKVKLIDIDAKPLNTPENIVHSAIVRMPAGEFQKFCHDLSQIGNAIQIECLSQREVKFYLEGDGVTANITLPYSERVRIQLFKLVALDSVDNSFLKLISKVSPISKEVEFSLTNDHLAVEYSIGQHSYLRYYFFR